MELVKRLIDSKIWINNEYLIGVLWGKVLEFNSDVANLPAEFCNTLKNDRSQPTTTTSIVVKEEEPSIPILREAESPPPQYVHMVALPATLTEEEFENMYLTKDEIAWTCKDGRKDRCLRRYNKTFRFEIQRLLDYLSDFPENAMISIREFKRFFLHEKMRIEMAQGTNKRSLDSSTREEDSDSSKKFKV